MADYADVANDISEQDLGIALANIKHFNAVSNYECEDCGAEIPEQRRKLGSVTLCISYQSVLEAKQKHLRGRP